MLKLKQQDKTSCLLKRMTVNLLDTYTAIKKKVKRIQSSTSTINIQQLIEPETVLNGGRYRVIKKIGNGVFGVVVKAIDV